jgi:c-di-GMP-binding flagellar brake protein YcgR
VNFQPERRKHTRFQRRLKSEIILTNTSVEFDGITEDLSQGGAFILTPGWSEVQENDKTTVRLFLPPELTGQNDTLILQGSAVVRRAENNRGGIALQFMKQLKAFDVLR